jgi:MFS family permease
MTPLMLFLGWRASFAVLGGAGLLVAAAWGLIYRNAPRAAGKAIPVAGPVQWLGLLRQRTVWGLLLGFAGTVYITWLYVTWLPGYLHDRWHMSTAHAGLWSAVPQLFGFFGAVGGGWLSDRLMAITSERAARQWPLVIGLYIAGGCSALAAFSGSVALAITAVSGALFAANLATTAGWALAASLAPVALIATVEAMANIGGSIGGSLAPLVTGGLVQATHSFQPALLIAAATAAGCGIANQSLTRQAIAATP